MYNYTNFFIDKIQTFALADIDLNAILPQANIRKNSTKQVAEFPSVVVQTIENTADEFSYTQEAITFATIQVEVNCQDMLIGATFYEATDACEYISEKVGNYLEDDLHLPRLTKTDAIPTDIENQVFSLYLRYRIRHNLLLNLIT